jgi:hypothetical protein
MMQQQQPNHFSHNAAAAARQYAICIQPTGVRTIISIYCAAASVLCVKAAILGCAAI